MEEEAEEKEEEEEKKQQQLQKGKNVYFLLKLNIDMRTLRKNVKKTDCWKICDKRVL